MKEEKKELIKEKDEKEFVDEKKKAAESKGFLKRVFRRKKYVIFKEDYGTESKSTGNTARNHKRLEVALVFEERFA